MSGKRLRKRNKAKGRKKKGPPSLFERAYDKAAKQTAGAPNPLTPEEFLALLVRIRADDARNHARRRIRGWFLMFGKPPPDMRAPAHKGS